MGNKEENILSKICLITESNAGFVFKSNGLDKVILFSVGCLNWKNKNLQTIIKKIATKKEPTFTDIKNSNAYKAYCREYGYKTFYKELFLKEEKSKYYLLLFSKNKMPDQKTCNTKIASLLNELKN
jgi:hypothetical protein